MIDFIIDNKSFIKKTFEKKITSKFESYDKKIINSFNKNKKTSMKQSLFQKKLIKNNYNIRHSLNYLRNNIKDDFNHNLKEEYLLIFNIMNNHDHYLDFLTIFKLSNA